MASRDGFNLRPLIVVLLAVSCCCQAFSDRVRTSRPILKPSPDDTDHGTTPFDIGCVANPVILPPANGEWQCYYYGNAGSWNRGGIPASCRPAPRAWPSATTASRGPGSPAGRRGAPSWRRPGRPPTGTRSRPAWETSCASAGTRCTCTNFGGSDEALPMGPGGAIVGFRMRIGRARSADNGRTWIKDDTYLLDFDEREGLFASWPKIVPNEDGPWNMFYHAFNGDKWRVFGAESTDQGDTWTRTGLVIEGGTSDDDFDFGGIGTRDITPWRDGLLMIYEGVDKSSTHRLGAAFCEAGAATWTKLNDGRPILEPGAGPLGAWTQQVIGTPCVVALPDGSLRVYHCAKDGPDGKMAIGVVESKSGDISPKCWEAIA